ncbi:hypothetical protein P175DRAFT_0193952 [Aspergillus ochraceoroseus IBT 24754]|uniref:Uncharacterized protein n=1 Tax=Aspergillus ochraceoroseus IBT 24754 TaxID=1392256 RepID=A0A2T5LZD2_9EURO|nr:uncharacterized protein P175DRAFT_0193952 [Aspergillus ochraceoroseus IBT 24754]PTU21640.1 hypothetical protein P175DRAFT_0193952 [Aspergillus ochraceoroseus IBT 24754]
MCSSTGRFNSILFDFFFPWLWADRRRRTFFLVGLYFLLHPRLFFFFPSMTILMHVCLTGSMPPSPLVRHLLKKKKKGDTPLIPGCFPHPVPFYSFTVI